MPWSWIPGKVKMMTEGGERTVVGLVTDDMPGIAISPSRVRRGPCYAITHLASGYALCYFETEEEARSTADLMITVARDEGWSFEESAQVLKHRIQGGSTSSELVAAIRRGHANV